MGKLSRNKGKSGELELSHFLTERGFPARRGQQFSGGSDSPDVVCELLPHLECKRCERLSLYPALEQAQEDGGADAIVFHRRNRKPWIVVMDAKQFLALLSQDNNEFSDADIQF